MDKETFIAIARRRGESEASAEALWTYTVLKELGPETALKEERNLH